MGKDGVFFYQSAVLALQTAHFAFQLLHDLGILTYVEIDRHKILLQVDFYFLKMTKEKIFYKDFLKKRFVFGFTPSQNPAFQTKMSVSPATSPKNYWSGEARARPRDANFLRGAESSMAELFSVCM